MGVNVACAVFTIGVGTDQSLMPRKIGLCIFHADGLRPLTSQVVVSVVFRVVADDIVVAFDFIISVVLVILLVQQFACRGSGNEGNEEEMQQFLENLRFPEDDADMPPGYLRQKAENVLQNVCSCGAIILPVWDSRFPGKLRDYHRGPVILYCRGNVEILQKPCVGIVGARRCSLEGKEKAIRLAEQVVGAGQAVVSGLAKGIDSYAHTAALKAHGATIAVLGNGIDICYPAEHTGLMKRVISEGLVVSEYPPGIRPARYRFVERNRIIAGLSRQLYIVEAGRNSGTNSTKNFAEEMKTPIFLPECNLLL